MEMIPAYFIDGPLKNETHTVLDAHKVQKASKGSRFAHLTHVYVSTSIWSDFGDGVRRRVFRYEGTLQVGCGKDYVIVPDNALRDKTTRKLRQMRGAMEASYPKCEVCGGVAALEYSSKGFNFCRRHMEEKRQQEEIEKRKYERERALDQVIRMSGVVDFKTASDVSAWYQKERNHGSDWKQLNIEDYADLKIDMKPRVDSVELFTSGFDVPDITKLIGMRGIVTITHGQGGRQAGKTAYMEQMFGRAFRFLSKDNPKFKWDSRFMRMAREVSQWSKDPSTKVGAVLVHPTDKRIVSTGYNGLPRGLPDTNLDDRESKYSRTIHAEMNAILHAKEPTQGLTLYVYALPCCDRCAAHVIQAGITRVVMIFPKLATRWDEAGDRGWKYFKDAGVQVEHIREEDLDNG